jgi:hypothetical protein
VERNRVVDSGTEEAGYAVDIQGETRSILLRGNHLIETRSSQGRTGVRIGERASEVTLEGNEFTGFEHNVEDLRSG